MHLPTCGHAGVSGVSHVKVGARTSKRYRMQSILTARACQGGSAQLPRNITFNNECVFVF